MTYKLIVQNSKLVLKTLAGNILNVTGIKDLFTGTGSVTNNLINWKLLHYTDTSANLALLNPVLGLGQIAFTSDLLYSGTNQPRFKVGNGTDVWSDLNYIPPSGQAATETELFIFGTDPLVLTQTPTAIVSVFAGASVLFLTDDYTRSGSTITINTNHPFVSNGDKIRITYTY